jgi:hypothetical protein
VWDARDKASAFAEELRRRTGDKGWEVLPVNGPRSEGPMGPLLIQLARRGEGLIFTLHPLGRVLVASAYPTAFGVNTVSVSTQTWDDFRTAQRGLAELVREVMPRLTGLSAQQLDTLGYAVIDDQSGETLVFASPEVASQS